MAVNRLAVLGITVDPTKAIAGSRRANAAIAGVGRAASNVKNRIFSLQGALVALGDQEFPKNRFLYGKSENPA